MIARKIVTDSEFIAKMNRKKRRRQPLTRQERMQLAMLNAKKPKRKKRFFNF
jgi:hypothetical protein